MENKRSNKKHKDKRIRPGLDKIVSTTNKTYKKKKILKGSANLTWKRLKKPSGMAKT